MSSKPSAAARTHLGNDAGIVCIGAIANHVMSAFDWHVEHRQAVDVDAHAQQIVCDQTRGEADRGGALFKFFDVREASGGGIAPPNRRAEALDASTLLIHQDHRIVVAERRSDLRGQRTDLIWIGDVALEKDDAERSSLLEEGFFFGIKGQPEAATNKRADHGCERPF